MPKLQQEWVVVRAQAQVWGGTCPAVGNRRLTWRQRWGVLLEVFDDEGRRGVGEASPLPGFSRESLEDCRHALEAWCRALPLPVNMSDLTKPLAVMPRPPAARFAVETALLDVQARRGEINLPRLLSRELSGPTFVSRLLFGRRMDLLAEQVRRGLEQGFHTFKLKLGGVKDATRDVRLVQLLRAAVPGDWRLRVDLNAAWNLTQWERFQRGFADARVELVEDPVAAEELPFLSPSDVPVAADEALKREELPWWLAQSRSCLLWVLKPTVLGGFSRCRELFALAQRAGIQCLVSHCFEGPVALAAVRAAALLFGCAQHPERQPLSDSKSFNPKWQDWYANGVDLHPALAAFPALPVPGGAAAELYPWDSRGMGVEP